MKRESSSSDGRVGNRDLVEGFVLGLWGSSLGWSGGVGGFEECEDDGALRGLGFQTPLGSGRREFISHIFRVGEGGRGGGGFLWSPLVAMLPLVYSRLVGWLISFTLAPRNEKRYAGYNYIYVEGTTS